MTDTLAERTSLWEATTSMEEHPALAFNVRVNIAIVGGGVAGVTSAYLLKKLGQTVALIDGNHCGTGQTGRTTGHLTAAADLKLTALVDRLGGEKAKVAWEAGSAAIARIRAIVRDERINCQFGWVPAYLHGAAGHDFAALRDDLMREVAVAEALGIHATYCEHVPGLGKPGVRFDGQARIHPLSYLRVLVDQLPGSGSYVFENTYVDAIDDEGPFVVRSGEYRVVADYVIAATHATLFDELMQRHGGVPPHLGASRTYVVAGTAPGNVLDEGLYWEDDGDPPGCLRVDRQDGHMLAMVGGIEAPSPGITDARAMFARLTARLAECVPGVRPQHHWSGYVVESADRLPCVGEVAPGRFAVTALGENSLVFGTLGGMLAADAALRRHNRWADLFGFTRFAEITTASGSRSR